MACRTELRFPPDVMLKFYAYYKKGKRGAGENVIYTPARSQQDVLNGFKANALLQVENLTPQEAREKYIQMVEKYIGEV